MRNELTATERREEIADLKYEILLARARMTEAQRRRNDAVRDADKALREIVKDQKLWISRAERAILKLDAMDALRTY